MKRLLSCDGGGIRGCLIACDLVELERQTEKLTREVFDYVAGTSTGALIAAAVAAGVPAANILSVYTQRAGEIFNHPTLEAWALRIARGYAYESANIANVLRSVLGAAASWTLNDSPVRILLTAKAVNLHPWYFVQDRPKNAKTTGKCSLVDCATASAAAPTYFDPWYVAPGERIIGWAFDGGTGVAGNPVYQACLEAFEYDDFGPADTQVISFGTGWTPDGAVNPPSGLLDTLEWTINALVDAPVDEQSQIVEARWPGIMTRINYLLPVAVDMADTSQIPALVQIGQKAAAGRDWEKMLR